MEPVHQIMNKKDKDKVLELLQEKINNSIINKTAISISIEESFMTLLDSIYIEQDEYELDENHLYLEKDKLKFNIEFNDKVKTKYNNSFEESFEIVHKDTKINLYFYE